MKTFKIMPLILILCVFASMLAPAAAAAQVEEPEVGALSALLVELDTHQVFYAKHPDLRVYPASLTKIMTLLLVMEAIDTGEFSLYDKVTAKDSKDTDLEKDSESIVIRTGEVMTLENLIYCAMLSSSNAACNIIAEYIAGSIPAFVDMMNERARELGCVGTNFVNVHGLHNENHYTTAEDLALIAREAISHDLFREICNTVSYSVPATNYSPVRELKTTNHLINKDSSYKYYYEGASGIKTGYTSASGYCLVSTASRNNINLLCIVTGCEAKKSGNRITSIGSFTDTISLYDWAFSNFSYQDVVTADQIIANVPVNMASGTDHVALKPAGDISALLPNDTDPESFRQDVVIFSEKNGEELTAPITAGTVLGQLTVSGEDRVYGTVPLVAATSVDLSKVAFLRAKLAATTSDFRVRLVFWILAVLTLVYVALVIRYRVLRIRYVKALQKAEEMAAASAPAAVPEPAPTPEPAAEPEPISEPEGTAACESVTLPEPAAAPLPVPEIPPAAEPPVSFDEIFAPKKTEDSISFEEVFKPRAPEKKTGLLAKLKGSKESEAADEQPKNEPSAPVEEAVSDAPAAPASDTESEAFRRLDAFSKLTRMEDAASASSSEDPSIDPILSFVLDKELLEKLNAPIWTAPAEEVSDTDLSEAFAKLSDLDIKAAPPADEQADKQAAEKAAREKAERDYFEEFFRKNR